MNHYILRLIKLIILDLYFSFFVSIKISRLKIFSFYCIENILKILAIIYY